ncbi:MAG: chemotaxis protein CheW [Verrucomicrobiota bacterium]|nr:chemotaxis protein CheW [Verrucomicrobiota bacterium]
MNPEDEVFKNFLVEMGEKLEELENGLAELEDGFSQDVVNKLFRAVHTIKGGGGFFGLTKVSELSHVFEDVLMKVREGELPYADHMLGPFYSACDALKGMHEAEDYGNNSDINQLCSELRQVEGGAGTEEVPSPSASEVEPEQRKDEEKTPIEKAPSNESSESSAPEDLTPKTKPEEAKAPAEKSNKSPVVSRSEKSVNQNETIRVKVDLLNKLMELTGEIVLGRNQLLRQFAKMDDKSNLVAMAHMISDLQQLVLQTRMQPIGGTFTNFKRIVRDLAKQLDKPIDLVIKGEDTELDRSIIESLSDPLTHLIRNCADHGLEDPSTRIGQGKDRVGTVWLQARHEGGQVVITVEDDGKGIDAEKVKAKAVANNVISQTEADAMGENEAAKLIFHPGLSTAEAVTSLSGRGVGMDVVKSTFEKLGGAIDLETNLGSGTKVIIHLPTTLTIMSSLIVRIEGDRYAVPHSELKEVILVRPEDEIQIEQIRDREVYRLRGNLIPILSMEEITGVRREVEKDGKLSSKSGEVLFLVLHSGLNQFGLLIDSIDHTEEIVVKPLAQILSSHTFYAGSSILGDSDVAMVLSANGICQSHKLHIHDLDTSVQSTKSFEEMQILDMQEKQDLLVFRYSRNEQLAIPLSLVFKVEQIEVGQIQNVADNHFINLEGKNILLLYLDKYLTLEPLPEDLETFYIITPKIKDFEVGIVASSIEESVHTRLNLDSPPINEAAILGITTIREKITFLVDLFSLAEQVSPDRFKRTDLEGKPEKDRLLVVEDTPFFRDLEKTYFESVGFRVTLANNGQEALDLLMERPNYYNLVVSDIVMPVMDGYELVKTMKSAEKLSKIPVIALTSFTEEESREKALEAGFDGYAIKTNKENILRAVERFLVEE